MASAPSSSNVSSCTVIASPSTCCSSSAIRICAWLSSLTFYSPNSSLSPSIATGSPRTHAHWPTHPPSAPNPRSPSSPQAPAPLNLTLTFPDEIHHAFALPFYTYRYWPHIATLLDILARDAGIAVLAILRVLNERGGEVCVESEWEWDSWVRPGWGVELACVEVQCRTGRVSTSKSPWTSKSRSKTPPRPRHQVTNDDESSESETPDGRQCYRGSYTFSSSSTNTTSSTCSTSCITCLEKGVPCRCNDHGSNSDSDSDSNFDSTHYYDDMDCGGGGAGSGSEYFEGSRWRWRGRRLWIGGCVVGSPILILGFVVVVLLVFWL